MGGSDTFNVTATREERRLHYIALIVVGVITALGVLPFLQPILSGDARVFAVLTLMLIAVVLVLGGLLVVLALLQYLASRKVVNLIYTVALLSSLLFELVSALALGSTLGTNVSHATDHYLFHVWLTVMSQASLIVGFSIGTALGGKPTNRKTVVGSALALVAVQAVGLLVAWWLLSQPMQGASAAVLVPMIAAGLVVALQFFGATSVVQKGGWRSHEQLWLIVGLVLGGATVAVLFLPYAGWPLAAAFALSLYLRGATRLVLALSFLLRLYKLFVQVRLSETDLIDRAGALERQRRMANRRLEAERREKALLAEETLQFKNYLKAVEDSNDHIVITDTDGVIVYANKAAEANTGYSKAEMIGATPELWGGQMPKEYYARMWQTLLKEQRSFNGDFRNRRKSGELYDAEAHISPVKDDNDNLKYFIGIERDVTEIKAIDRAKTEFVSLASHQLRTPLSSMNWYLEMLLDGEAGKLQSKQQKFVEEIFASNKRMINLVNDLLNVSRIELGTMRMHHEQVDIGALAAKVVHDMHPSIDKNRQVVDLHAPKEPLKVNIDPAYARMMLDNLVTNAIKYTPAKGHIVVTVKRIAAGATLPNSQHAKYDSVMVQVADTGMGIPSNEAKHIFEKLYRASNAARSDAVGSGLGLYITRAIIEQLGGDIWFAPNKPNGTVFTAVLPQHTTPHQSQLGKDYKQQMKKEVARARTNTKKAHSDR